MHKTASIESLILVFSYFICHLLFLKNSSCNAKRYSGLSSDIISTLKDMVAGHQNRSRQCAVHKESVFTVNLNKKKGNNAAVFKRGRSPIQFSHVWSSIRTRYYFFIIFSTQVCKKAECFFPYHAGLHCSFNVSTRPKGLWYFKDANTEALYSRELKNCYIFCWETRAHHWSPPAGQDFVNSLLFEGIDFSIPTTG